MKLSEIPRAFDLDVSRDGDFSSLGFVSYETAGLLVFLEDEKYLDELRANANVTCVVTTAALASKMPSSVGVAAAKSPRVSFYRFHNHLAMDTEFYWKSFKTEIAASAKIHPRAYVAEMNVRVGERSVVEANATIQERSIIGDDCVIRSGAVVGGEGFQFVKLDGHLVAVLHVGGAKLERGVEIQQNSMIDRSVFGGFTVVGEETKTDNKVHIAHNCQLGKRNLLAAGAMLAGSVRTGDDVWFGPMCAISDGVQIGSRASISIGAVVTRDVPEGARVSGNFAIDHTRFLDHMRAIR